MWDSEYGYKAPKTRSVLLDDECVKCGSFDNSFRFHTDCDLSDIEHLHYSCYTCGYAWTGETVEQMRDKSGYFDKWHNGAVYTMGDWSDWDEYEDEDSAIPDDYEPSLSRKYGSVLSER